MHLTTGIELTTAISNIFILVVSILGLIKIKKDGLWRLFFILMTMASAMGVIVHGIAMSIEMNIILWIILSIIFTFTINTFLVIFLKFKIKHIIILSVLLTIFMLVQIYFDLDFILSFTLYVLLIVIISFYYLLKDKEIKNKKYFIAAFLVTLIGGSTVFTDIKIYSLNHNGIAHIFLAIALLLFIIGLKKE